MKKILILITTLLTTVVFNTTYASEIEKQITPFKIEGDTVSYIDDNNKLYSKGSTSYKQYYVKDELEYNEDEYEYSPTGYIGEGVFNEIVNRSYESTSNLDIVCSDATNKVKDTYVLRLYGFRENGSQAIGYSGGIYSSLHDSNPSELYGSILSSKSLTEELAADIIENGGIIPIYYNNYLYYNDKPATFDLYGVYDYELIYINNSNYHEVYQSYTIENGSKNQNNYLETIKHEITYVNNEFTNEGFKKFNNITDYSFFHEHGALINNGKVYTSGSNFLGQLGTGNYSYFPCDSYTSTFNEVNINNLDYNAVRVETSKYNTIVLLDDGSLYGCGVEYVLLGNGRYSAVDEFIEIKNDETINSGAIVDFKICNDSLFILYENGDLFNIYDRTNYSDPICEKIATNVLFFDGINSLDNNDSLYFVTNQNKLFEANKIYSQETYTYTFDITELDFESNYNLTLVSGNEDYIAYLDSNNDLYIDNKVINDVIYFDLNNEFYTYMTIDGEVVFSDDTQGFTLNNTNIQFYYSNLLTIPPINNLVFKEELSLDFSYINTSYDIKITIYKGNTKLSEWIHNKETSKFPKEAGDYKIVAVYIDSDEEVGTPVERTFTINKDEFNVSINNLDYLQDSLENLNKYYFNEIKTNIYDYITIDTLYKVQNNNYVQTDAVYNITIKKDGELVSNFDDYGTYTLCVEVESDNYKTVQVEQEFTIIKQTINPIYIIVPIFTLGSILVLLILRSKRVK